MKGKGVALSGDGGYKVDVVEGPGDDPGFLPLAARAPGRGFGDVSLANHQPVAEEPDLAWPGPRGAKHLELYTELIVRRGQAAGSVSAIHGNGGEQPQADRDFASQERLHGGLDINLPRVAVRAGDVGSSLSEDLG